MQTDQPHQTTALDQRPGNLHARYLVACLARIDLLLQREVQRWRMAGQEPNDDYRGLFVSDRLADALLKRPFGSNWGDGVVLDALEETHFTSALADSTLQVEQARAEARQAGEIPRLDQLQQLFGLDDFERDTLLVYLAPALDLRYERIYGYLQDDLTRRLPTVSLVLDLLCLPGSERLQKLANFRPDAHLRRFHLLECAAAGSSVRPGLLNQAFCVEESVVAWLLGGFQPQTRINALVQYMQPVGAGANERVLAGAAWTELEGGLRRRPGLLEDHILAFYGPDHVAQDAAARLLAGQSGRPMLHLDLAAAAADEEPLAPILAAALRDARLTNALLFIQGWDACLVDNSPPPAILAELSAHPGWMVTSGQVRWLPRSLPGRLQVYLLEFGRPAYNQRKAIWDLCLSGSSSGLEADGIAALSAHFMLTAGQIQDAAATALEAADRRGKTVTIEDLFAAARTHSNPRLASLANKIEPRYGWEDIILPPDQRALLSEIIQTVRRRSRVLEEWGVGEKLVSSRGVTVLFAGPPGTGKTMAAEIIAGKLGLDLYKIDLSTIISKYIGETEKNLERIFTEASSSNAILFFDEADAMFGKRSEVRDSHDRYANIEISYLLQRMENYDGITILATNLRANLDQAFTRRLQFAVDFPFPEEDDRLRIWQSLFPPGVPRAPNLDLALMAQRFKLAGGNIRNILVSAAYLAADDGGQVTMSHLLYGARREMQKMGRLIGSEDLFTE